MNIEDVKVLRLKTGDDIIGIVTMIDSHQVNIRYPMSVEVTVVGGKQSLVMYNWLSHQLFKNLDVNIWENDILFSADPTDEFIEHYQTMVDRLEQYIMDSEIMDHLEEEQLLMEAMDEKALNVIH